MVQSYCSWIYLWGSKIIEGCLYLPVYMPVILLDYNLLRGNNCVFSSTYLLYLFQLSGIQCFPHPTHRSYLRMSKFSKCLVIYVESFLSMCKCKPAQQSENINWHAKNVMISWLHQNLQSMDPTTFHSPSPPLWPLPLLDMLEFHTQS